MKNLGQAIIEALITNPSGKITFSSENSGERFVIEMESTIKSQVIKTTSIAVGRIQVEQFLAGKDCLLSKHIESIAKDLQ